MKTSLSQGIRVIYEEAESNQTETQRRLDAAFDVLFESIWPELEALPHPPLPQYLDATNVSTSLEEVRS